MDKKKGIAALAVIIIIVGAVVAAGAGVLVYQHYYPTSRPAVVYECQTQKNCQDTYKDCYYTCSGNKCVSIDTFVALKPYPDCSSGLACTPEWQCGWGTCVNGSQSQVAVDSNNCGLPPSTAQIACPALARVCDDSVQPFINLISPNPARVGQAITVTGASLNGFEGDKNLWIENSAGQRGVIYGDKSSTGSVINFTLADSYCTLDNSYSGLPCPSYITIVPGTYSIYASPWGTASNKLSFAVTSSTQLSITVFSPNGGETWRPGQKVSVQWITTGIPVNPPTQVDIIDDRVPGWSAYSVGTIPALDFATLSSSGGSVNAYNYSFTVPDSFSLPTNTFGGDHYKAEVSVVINQDQGTPSGQIIRAFSDKGFSINNPATKITISGITPKFGIAGTQITIYGNGFSYSDKILLSGPDKLLTYGPNNNSQYFKNINTDEVSQDGSQIKFTIPADTPVFGSTIQVYLSPAMSNPLPFNIISSVNQQTLKITSPNGQVYYPNGSYEDCWTASSGIAAVNLIGYPDDDPSLRFGAQNLPVSLGCYPDSTGPSPMLGNTFEIEGLDASGNVVADAKSYYTIASSPVK